MNRIYALIDVGCRNCGTGPELVRSFPTRDEAARGLEELEERGSVPKEGYHSYLEVLEVTLPFPCLHEEEGDWEKDFYRKFDGLALKAKVDYSDRMAEYVYAEGASHAVRDFIREEKRKSYEEGIIVGEENARFNDSINGLNG